MIQLTFHKIDAIQHVCMYIYIYICFYVMYVSLILSAVCLTTGPHPLPKRVFHRARSSSSFLIYSILSFPSGHPVAAYTFLLVLQSILSFGGLEVAYWPLVPKFVGSNPAEAVGFFRAKKNPQHDFLREGSKAVCLMSHICGM